MGLKFTFRNVVFVIYVFFMALLTPVFFLPAVFIYLFSGQKNSDRYINQAGSLYARHLFFVFGVKVEVKGRENLPAASNICFVSNHQGLADIPLIVGFVPKTVGFVAKKELGRIPILNIWMKAMRCLLIDRKDVRQSLTVIERGARQIRNGHPMVIFPEGTRSRRREPGNFKAGAFKLVTGSQALAVPLTIDGTYKLLEESGIINPTLIRLTIHPPIDVSQLNEQQKKNLPQDIREIIISALTPEHASSKSSGQAETPR